MDAILPDLYRSHPFALSVLFVVAVVFVYMIILPPLTWAVGRAFGTFLKPFMWWARYWLK
jgi:hypothetical protein